jgi:hypothetical protein
VATAVDNLSRPPEPSRPKVDELKRADREAGAFFHARRPELYAA